MTGGQYRSLVAYLNFWTPQYPQMNLDTAIRDIGITEDRQSVIWHLSSCLWEFNEETGLLTYSGDDHADAE